MQAHILGSLMGQKLVLTEFIAYGNLAAVSETVSDRTATITHMHYVDSLILHLLESNWRNWFNCTKRKRFSKISY